MIDMFDILELPKEKTKGVEQFTPLEQSGEKSEEETESVSEHDYDSLVKTIEELKTLLTTNKNN